MTPKEKAKELYKIFYITIPSDEMGLCDNAAKKCALIAVDEIVEICEFAAIGNLDDIIAIDRLNYWDKVKQEIEKL